MLQVCFINNKHPDNLCQGIYYKTYLNKKVTLIKLLESLLFNSFII